MSPKLLNTFLLIASFALYYVVIGPLWTGIGTVWSPAHGITDLRSSEAQYANTVDQAADLFRQGKELRSQYEAIDEATKQKMIQMVPASIDPVRLLSEVNNIAAQSGIAITGVTYSEGGASDKLRGAYDLGFSVKTTYPKFKEFMRNYETSLRLFTLQSVSFSAPDKPDDLMTFQVKLRTYYLK